MNIKEKLTQQIAALEKAQTMAFGSGDYLVASQASMGILDYIKHIENYEDEDFICEDYLEAEIHEQMIDDIAKASDLPPELVQRVLDGQAEVLGMDS